MSSILLPFRCRLHTTAFHFFETKIDNMASRSRTFSPGSPPVIMTLLPVVTLGWGSEFLSTPFSLVEPSTTGVGTLTPMTAPASPRLTLDDD